MKLSSQLVVETRDSIDLDLVRDSVPKKHPWPFATGLCSILFFAILAFGAVDEWSTFVFEAGAAVLLLAWLGKQIFSAQLKVGGSPLYAPAFCFLALLLTQLLLHTSAYPYATKYELLQYISYGIVLLIATECLRQEDTREKFGFLLIGFGTLYAFYAMAQELTSPGRFFWFYTPRFHGSIYGSYVNHDHYAGLMEMLVPFPLVIAMGRMLRGAQRVLVFFCAVLMATTIVLSGSRGGMISFAFEVLALTALTLYQKRNPRIALATFALCSGVLGFLLFLGKGKVLGRLGDLGPDIRLRVTADCLKIFAHKPLLGWGLGTFPTIYPSFRSFYTNLFVNQAHNDYAQLLVETGVLGFGLMLWFIFLLYRHGFPTSRRWEFKWDAAVSLAALLGCTALLLHSLVDFNLHVPANAAMFYALCALAAARPASTSSKPRSLPRTASSRRKYSPSTPA